MTKKKLESTILKGVERISRKEAMSCKTYPTAPWPDCRIILHKPKRPKKKALLYSYGGLDQCI